MFPVIQRQLCSQRARIRFNSWRRIRSHQCWLFSSPGRRRIHNDNYSYSSSPSMDTGTRPRKQDYLQRLSENWWKIHPDLQEYIRPCISGMDHGDDSILQTDFSVCFLGTGAGVPSTLRNSSATALRLKGMTYLFDAGEGVQNQVMLSGMNMSEINKIFITHLHGDHVFGLPGLLLAIQLVAIIRNEKQATIQIYGPVGLYNLIASSLSLCCAELNVLNVEVYELRGGSRRKWVHPGTIQHYPEFRHRGLVRKYIPQNKDGTWTLETAKEIQSPEDAYRFTSRGSSDERGLHVRAAQVSHVPALQCFGYVVQEPLTMPQKIDAKRAMAAGVAPGKKYRLLKAGFSVPRDDETRRVHPKDVMSVECLPVKSRKFALLGDCCGVPAPMAELCRDADVLVHEATLLQSDAGRKVERGGHSSAGMAGFFADYVQAKVVALNHISAKNKDNAAGVAEEATNAIKGQTRVQVAYDFLELLIPRTGFNEETLANRSEK